MASLSLTLSPRNWARLAALGWAAFLACSWTWCIGMFLPVLLVRDYGPIAWLVFAVPNVIGAGAMGWVLHRPESSGQFLARHAAAAVAFSTVTIAFHVYFIVCVIAPIFGFWTPLACLGLCAAFLLAGRSSGVKQLLIAAGVFLASLLMTVLTLSLGNLSSLAFSDTVLPTSLRTSLGWLIPVCCFGFLLCPYLDLTFHRARQSNSAPAARIAFGVGFGLLFVPMILFTLCYANSLIGVLANPRILSHGHHIALWIVLCHLLLQSAYTVALHVREIIPLRPLAWRMAHLVPVAAIVLLPLTAGGADWLLRALGFARGELGYRLFMVFYALIFPAYVYLCAVPSPGGDVGPTRRKLTVLGAVVLICMPLYWAAFVRGQMVWLGPAVAVALVSRWIAGAGARAPKSREVQAVR